MKHFKKMFSVSKISCIWGRELNISGRAAAVSGSSGFSQFVNSERIVHVRHSKCCSLELRSPVALPPPS